MTGGLLSSSPQAPCPCPVSEPPPLLQVPSTSAVSTVSILRLARDPRRSIEGGGLNAIVSAESPRLLAPQTRQKQSKHILRVSAYVWCGHRPSFEIVFVGVHH